MNLSPVVARPSPVFEFDDLLGLPCGCVTACFRARQSGVSLVSVEAKGPHCLLAGHFQGNVVELEGVTLGLADEDEAAFEA